MSEKIRSGLEICTKDLRSLQLWQQRKNNFKLRGSLLSDTEEMLTDV